MKLEADKPWLDEDGNELPFDQLKESSGSWSISTWEDYLLSRESPLQEGLFPNFDRILLKHDAEASFVKPVEDEDTDSGPLLLGRRTVRKHLTCLTYQQRRVIEMHFSEGEPLKDIARALGITRPAASIHLARGIKRLRSKLSPAIETKRKKSYCGEGH